MRREETTIERLSKIQTQLEHIRHKRDEVTGELVNKKLLAFLKFRELPSTEKIKVWEEWDKYFEEINNTVTYQMFQETKRAARKNDWGKVRELTEEAKKMSEHGHQITIPTPKGIYPKVFDQDQICLLYQQLESELKRLQDTLRFEQQQDGTDF